MSDRDEIEIVVPTQSGWDAEKEEFVDIKGCTIRMKHSLLSISKWEMTWKKPFLKYNYKMSDEELIDYYRCMTITQNVDPSVYYFIPDSEKQKINNYIQTPMSAFKSINKKKSTNREPIVSEKIYYWMVAQNIPSSYEKWHLSRLLNLIEIASDANDPKKSKKRPLEEIYRENTEINRARRKMLNSRG